MRPIWQFAVIDVSHHQRTIDFGIMRAQGVRGVILRCTNAHIRDSRFAAHYAAARAAGYDPRDIWVYCFVNPKRCTAHAAYLAVVEACNAVGHPTKVVMLDIEQYHTEPPVPGEPVRGAAFAAYLRTMRDLFRAEGWFVLGYGNASYYDPAVGDREFAASIPWIVARYPVFPPKRLLDEASAGNPSPLNEWVARSPKPPLPYAPNGGWEQWAWQRGPTGPYAPAGAVDVIGWQFSAGFNRQAALYGASGSDLDLNIVSEPFWMAVSRDLAPIPPTPEPPIPDLDQEDLPMPRLRQCPNDPAVFIECAGDMTMRSAVSQEVITDLVADGTLTSGTPTQINRRALKAYRLVGAIDYTTVAPDVAARLTDRTTPADFGAWEA